MYSPILTTLNHCQPLLTTIHNDESRAERVDGTQITQDMIAAAAEDPQESYEQQLGMGWYHVYGMMNGIYYIHIYIYVHM